MTRYELIWTKLHHEKQVLILTDKAIIATKKEKPHQWQGLVLVT